MLTRNSFYAMPKERLANLIPHPSIVEINGDLRISYRSRTREGEILLSDYVMPESAGPRPWTGWRYVAIGTRAEIKANSVADLNAISAMLYRAAKHLAA